MSSRPPRLLMVGYYGKGNFGDQLMIEGLVSALSDSEIAIVAYKETPFILSGVDIVFNNKKTSVYSSLYNFFNIGLSFYKCDVVIWGGGTCFYDDIKNGPKNLYGIIKIFLLTRIFRKKMVFLGVGIGELVHSRNKFFTRYILENSDLVTVRDSQSLDYVFNDAIRGNIHQTEDLAYLYNHSAGEVSQCPNKIIFCGLSHNNKPGYEDVIIVKNLARIFDQLIDAGYLIDMVPMHLGTSYDDIAFNSMVYEHIVHKEKCRLVSISPLRQVNETMLVLSAATAVVSMRLHGLIAGLMLKKRICAISDSKKIHSFMLDNGFQADLLRIKELDADVAASRILSSIRKQTLENNELILKRRESYENIKMLNKLLK